MNRANTIRYLYSIPLLLIFIAAGIVSVRAGIADLYSYSPRQHLEHWQKIGKTPSPDELAEALNNVESALSWQKNQRGILGYACPPELLSSATEISW